MADGSVKPPDVSLSTEERNAPGTQLNQQGFAPKPMEKAGANENSLTSASDLTSNESADDHSIRPAVADYGGTGRLSNFVGSLRRRKFTWIVATLVLIFLIFAVIKTQATAKSMIDNSSVGVDHLNIAFSPGLQSQRDGSLFLAAQEFTTLNARLNSWSWIVTASSVLPPIHDQFVAMDRLADLGFNIAAWQVATTGNERLGSVGSPEGICASAKRLSEFDGNLLNQLEKNRTQMLESLFAASQGTCGLDSPGR